MSMKKYAVDMQLHMTVKTLATLKGEINCKNSDVLGKIEGKIVAIDQLSLKATSVINGDLIASKLAIEPGARFTGNCNMSSNSLDQNATKTEEKEPKEQGKS